MATDWAKLKHEFVHSAKQLKEIAQAHDLKEGTVRARAKRDDWQRDRNATQRAVTQEASKRLTVSRVDELARFNEDDLKIAKGLRSKAVALLSKSPDHIELRSLAGTFETARRLGLSALGVGENGLLLDAGDDADLLPITVTIERKSARRTNASAE